MNKNEVKRVFRMFTIADYDKEEEFLREQHKAGYKFVRFQFPGFYYFEACEPEDVVYQLDFNDNIRKQDKADYLQLYKDTGWEYMFDVFEWSYFRKSASLEEEEPTIFTDKESKIELINRVFKRRMLPIIIVFFCCIIPEIIYMSHQWTKDGSDKMYALAFFVVYVIFFLIYLGIFIHCGGGLHRLKKDYENGLK